MKNLAFLSLLLLSSGAVQSAPIQARQGLWDMIADAVSAVNEAIGCNVPRLDVSNMDQLQEALMKHMQAMSNCMTSGQSFVALPSGFAANIPQKSDDSQSKRLEDSVAGLNEILGCDIPRLSLTRDDISKLAESIVSSMQATVQCVANGQSNVLVDRDFDVDGGPPPDGPNGIYSGSSPPSNKDGLNSRPGNSPSSSNRPPSPQGPPGTPQSPPPPPPGGPQWQPPPPPGGPQGPQGPPHGGPQGPPPPGGPQWQPPPPGGPQGPPGSPDRPQGPPGYPPSSGHPQESPDSGLSLRGSKGFVKARVGIPVSVPGYRIVRR